VSRTEPLFEIAGEHRRRTARQVRHVTRAHLQNVASDEEALDDVVLPTVHHDLGRKASPRPKGTSQAGRRPGFKVWKTPFWKRRRQLWAEHNASARLLG
jgi:hypothetical protein